MRRPCRRGVPVSDGVVDHDDSRSRANANANACDHHTDGHIFSGGASLSAISAWAASNRYTADRRRPGPRPTATEHVTTANPTTTSSATSTTTTVFDSDQAAAASSVKPSDGAGSSDLLLGVGVCLFALSAGGLVWWRRRRGLCQGLVARHSAGRPRCRRTSPRSEPSGSPTGHAGERHRDRRYTELPNTASHCHSIGTVPSYV